MVSIKYFNGKLITGRNIYSDMLEPGLLYGWGVFETLRFYNGKTVYLDRHLTRARRGLKLLNLQSDFSFSEIKKTIKAGIKLIKEDDCRLKTVFFKTRKGTGVLVLIEKYRPPVFMGKKQGFSACITGIKKDESSLLSGIKSLNYLACQLAYWQAKEKGFDEGLMINNKGMLVEGARTNIFLVKNSRIITPHLSSGCLPGITRQAVFDIAKTSSVKLEEANVRPDALLDCDEAFLTNSLMGVMPLVILGNKKISRGLAGDLTKFIQGKYNLLPEKINV